MIIKNRVMHTPEGMRDLYGKSLQDRRALMKRIHDVFESFGYSDIETPTIEYFDVFSSDIFRQGREHACSPPGFYAVRSKGGCDAFCGQ